MVLFQTYVPTHMQFFLESTDNIFICKGVGYAEYKTYYNAFKAS